MNKQLVYWLVLLLVALVFVAFVSLDTLRTETTEEGLSAVDADTNDGSADLENSGFIDTDAPEFID